MKIETARKGDVLILRILENLDINSDISELEKIIQKHVQQGNTSIAVSLTENSRLSSMSIGLLLRCYSTLKDIGGKLSLVQPNKGDSDLLHMLSFTCVMDIYNSEEELETGI